MQGEWDCAFLPLHLWKPPDAWWLTKKVRSKEYGSIFDQDHENGGSVKCNCKEHGFWRNTEPLGLYQFKLTLSEPQFPMWTNLMIIATSRVIMESKLNEILYTRYSKHWIQCLADTQLIVVTSIHYHHHILKKKNRWHVRYLSQDSYCWSTCQLCALSELLQLPVPHFLIHKMGVIVGTTHITVRNIIYTSIYGQFSSVAQFCLTLCDPIDCSMPGFPVYHQLPELSQTHVHWVSDTIQPSHALSSPSPSAFDLSQHQGLFQWVSSLQQVAEVMEFQLQHQSFHFIQDWFPLGLTGLISLQSKGLSRTFSNTTVQKHQFFSAQLSL